MEHLHNRQVEFLASWFSKERRYFPGHFHIHKVYSPFWEDSGTWKHSYLQASFWTDHLKASHCFQCEREDVWQDCCLGNRWGEGLHLPGHRPHQPWKSSKNLTFIKSVIWKKKLQLAWSGVYETPRNWVERPKVDRVGKMQMLRPLTGGLLLSALVFTDL